ncbi:MAG: hypothetical protein DRJ15_13135 [Bacteroidetes bacterium]|nr:MAG: hypothetical protein DRJ15_13135 [Bacteroidota bacterium]
MMAALLTTNSSDPYNSSIGYGNLTSIHLPINQFGIEYSLSEQPDNSQFHWFSEFNVVREMHQCINDIFYQEGYSRYSGVLELQGLYVAVLVETWSYAGEYVDVDYLVNITNPFTGEEYPTDLVYQPLYNANRVSAFKISFNFMNYRSDEQTFQDVSLVSYFKGDLYLNEDHELNKVGNSADILSLQNFTYDDSVYYNSTTQTIFVEDTNNDTFYIRDDNVTAMGFQSLSHTISTFAIGESMGLLKNITLEHLQASDWNTNIGIDSFLHGREGLDPGFASAYTLSDLTYGTNLEFSGTLSVGQGTSSENARNLMQIQSELIKNQVTNYNVTDLMVVSANFSRIIEKDNEYNMEVLILNLGNMPVDETQLAFMVNRTNDEDVYEIYTMLFNIHDFNPFELRSYTASWVPLKTGAYTMGIVIGDIEEMYATFKLFSGFESGLSQDYQIEMSTREINYMSNALSRTIIVIDPSYYNSLKYDHFEVYPYFLDQNPMKIYAPLDYAIYNLTTFTIWPIEKVTIGTDGIGSKLVFFLDSDLSNSNIQPLNSIQQNLSPYSAIPLVIFANPLTPPGEIHFNITFTAPGSNSPFYYLPVNLVITANRGRIWFDAVHMNFFVSQNLVGQSDISLDAISTDSLDILDNFGNFEGKDFQTKEGVFDLTRLVDYNERLDTTWGSYFKLRQLWADPANSFDGMKGTSLYTIFPLLSLNFSDFIDFDALPSSTEENSNDEEYFFNTADAIPDTSFLGDTIGNYAFESDTLSTSTINHDLLQFFDGLVINDPEQGFLLEEIDDIDEWVENGGTLYVWAEDQYHTNLTSLNELLDRFGFQLANSSFYSYLDNQEGEASDGYCHVDLSFQGSINHPIFNQGTKIPEFIALKDPLEVFLTDPSNPETILLGQKSHDDGVHATMGVGHKGKGKIVVIGDHDLFNGFMLNVDNNTAFAQNLLQWGLNNVYQSNVSISSPDIGFYEQGFIDVNITNFDEVKAKGLLDDGFLFVAAFFAANGSLINGEIYGIEIPILPMFFTDDSHYATWYDSVWSLHAGDYYVLLIIDHPAAASELIYIRFTVHPNDPPDPIIFYDIPQPLYSHWIDILGTLSITFMAMSLWYYNVEKYKNRLRITPLKGEYLNTAQTRINEGRTQLKLLLRGLEKDDVEEIERIRFLLANQNRLTTYLEDLKKFGESIGEHYK